MESLVMSIDEVRRRIENSEFPIFSEKRPPKTSALKLSPPTDRLSIFTTRALWLFMVEILINSEKY